MKVLTIDRRTLPKGHQYREAGFESRQIIDIDLSRVVTEYRAQVFEDLQGNRFVASFAQGANRVVQYGLALKANAVYMSQFQLIPYDRIRDHFQDQMSIPISAGSVFRFNQEAYGQLEVFGQWAKARLAKADLLHVDETGINVGGKRHWLHCASNPSATWSYPHARRGLEASGRLAPEEADPWRQRYRELLRKAETECPPPEESQRRGKRGRLKRSKSRNLLERLRNFEHDVLRFMEVESVPFTNNQGENDLRRACS